MLPLISLRTFYFLWWVYCEAIKTTDIESRRLNFYTAYIKQPQQIAAAVIFLYSSIKILFFNRAFVLSAVLL